MQGKVVVITGATSGIGGVAARRLAGMGARIVLIARDKARGEATLASLPGGGASGAHSIHYGDLSRISEMKRLARDIAAAEPRIDVLINNAGAVFGSRQLTEDNLERTFAINHMAYFALTLGLRERLLAAAPARIVNTASNAHKGAKLDFDDLQAARGLFAHEGIRTLQAMQHPVHSRTCTALARAGCHGQLPAPGFRGDTHRR